MTKTYSRISKKKINEDFSITKKDLQNELQKIILKFDSSDLQSLMANFLCSQGWSYEVAREISTKEFSTKDLSDIYDELFKSKIWAKFLEEKVTPIIVDKFPHLWNIF